MKFPINPKYKDGEVVALKKFAWFPIRAERILGGLEEPVTVWLEYYLFAGKFHASNEDGPSHWSEVTISAYK